MMTALLAACLAPLVLLTLCFAIEIAVGLQPQRPESVVSNATPTYCVIMPAHNEGKIIRKSIYALFETGVRPTDVLVVADNCSDDTAAVARETGAQVIERQDSQNKGKGFALAYARDHLRRRVQPSAIIVLDADCTTSLQSLSLLVAACSFHNRPCQAANLLSAAPDSSPRVQISTFAFFVKNIVRQRALQRLSGRVHLLGTGMAFPWWLFDRASLATASIVEDLQLGIELASTGSGPLFVEEALVLSPAEAEENTLVQRTRWEGGFLKTAFRAAPRQMRLAISRMSLRDAWAAINLMIPPVALLFAVDLIATVVSFVLWFVWRVPLVPSLCLTASLALAALLLILVWTREGRRFVSARNLGSAALYVLWKIPMYLHLARPNSAAEWTRTRG